MHIEVGKYELEMISNRLMGGFWSGNCRRNEDLLQLSDIIWPHVLEALKVLMPTFREFAIESPRHKIGLFYTAV